MEKGKEKEGKERGKECGEVEKKGGKGERKQKLRGGKIEERNERGKDM